MKNILIGDGNEKWLVWEVKGERDVIVEVEARARKNGQGQGIYLAMSVAGALHSLMVWGRILQWGVCFLCGKGRGRDI